MWLCGGCVVVWLCGCVVVWLCGCVLGCDGCYRELLEVTRR